jgi:hypothetical protein
MSITSFLELGKIVMINKVTILFVWKRGSLEKKKRGRNVSERNDKAIGEGGKKTC